MKLAYITLGALGHVLPSLPLVGELVKKGVDVTYFAAARFSELAERSGARYVELPISTEDVILPEGDFLSTIPCLFLGEARGVIDVIMENIERDKPDAIMADSFALAGKYASYKTGLPLIFMFSGLASGEPFSVSRSWPKYPDDDPGRALALSEAREMQARFGGPLQTFDQIFDSWADYNIVNVTKSFHPAAEAFDEKKFFFAGAQIAPRMDETDWEAPDNGKPLLYTSLGSVFNDWLDFYGILFEAVKDMDINVLCSIGKKLKREDIGPVPANVTLMEFVPQLEVLSHCDYFITHTGINSLMEAMYFGVPLLCVPQMEEQKYNAGHAVDMGVASACLTKGEVTAEALRINLEKMMKDPSYRKNALAIREEMHRDGGCTRAAEAVIRFVSSTNP